MLYTNYVVFLCVLLAVSARGRLSGGRSSLDYKGRAR